MWKGNVIRTRASALLFYLCGFFMGYYFAHRSMIRTSVIIEKALGKIGDTFALDSMQASNQGELDTGGELPLYQGALNTERELPQNDEDEVIKPSHKNHSSPDPCSLSTAFRRRVAATLVEIQRGIHRLAGRKGMIDAKWAVQLAAIAEELDPRISLTEVSTWDFSARLPDMDSAPQSKNVAKHVCSEVFNSARLMDKDHYRQRSFTSEKCSNVPDFSSVLTAVLPAISWTPDTINFVVQHIRIHYDIQIVALVSSVNKINTNVSAFSVRELDSGYYDEGQVMNELVSTIKTPFVLFATSLVHFNNQSSLERLVRVLDDLEHVKVAGGAARDLTGLWIHGCLQQRMANYEAHYSMGYYYSKYECMYCDDLLTPFVTTTEFLREIPFRIGFNNSNVIYRDWFANVLVNGHLSVTCPDVMFYVDSHPNVTEDQWLMLAKQWSLEKITSYDNTQHKFSCSSVGITCKNALRTIRSFLLPPCCRAMMERYLSYITDFAEKHKLAYELVVGSAAGAVKMDGYLPWDFDMDIGFECKDYDKWMKSKSYLKSKGCKLVIMRKYKYVQATCPNFFLELYCIQQNNTSQQFLPPEYRLAPTIINYSNRYVVVNANPGLHTRCELGLEALRHASHKKTLKVSSLSKAKGGYDKPGVWNPCKNPKHHSCLDHYPGDGSLPFQKPFLFL